MGNKSFVDGFSSPWIVKLPVMKLTDEKEYYLVVWGLAEQQNEGTGEAERTLTTNCLIAVKNLTDKKCF